MRVISPLPLLRLPRFLRRRRRWHGSGSSPALGKPGGRTADLDEAVVQGLLEEVSGQQTNRRIDVGGRLIHVGARARTVAPVDVPWEP